MSPGSGMLAAWIVVALAGLGTLAGLFVLTRRIPQPWLRSLVRCLAAVWLLLPAKIQIVPGYYAPAYIVLIFEGVFRAGGDPRPALTVLIMGTLVVVALFLGRAAWHIRRARAADEGAELGSGRAPEPASAEEARA